MKKTTMMLGAAAIAAYLLTRKSGGMKGLGDIDPGSPEYAQWYYSVYLPIVQQQGSMSYQYGNYGASPAQCAQRGALWDSFTNQCSSQNPNTLLNPYSQYPGQQGNAQQCIQQGGYWDAFNGRCSVGAVVQQPYNPFQGQPYNPFQTQPYQYAPAQPAVSTSVDQLISQGLSTGVIRVLKQSRVVCRANQSQYCNMTFVDAATGKRKMGFKAAAAYVQRMGVGQSMVSYQPAINPAYQPAQTPPSQAMNSPYSAAGMPSVESQDISWAIDGGGA